MFRILPLLCDIGLGILATLLAEWLLGAEFGWMQYVVGILAAFLLDVDVIFHKSFWKDFYPATYGDDPQDHRELMHKPVIWLLVCVAFAVLVSREWGVILGLSIFAHFIHDTAGVGWGIQWLWPATRRYYKLFSTRENQLSLRSVLVSWSYEEFPEYMRKYGVKDWIQLMYLRPTPVSVIEYSIFALGIAALAYRFMHP